MVVAGLRDRLSDLLAHLHPLVSMSGHGSSTRLVREGRGVDLSPSPSRRLGVTG